VRPRLWSIKGGCEKFLFSWFVGERRCELSRLLYSKRVAPVSSNHKKIFARARANEKRRAKSTRERMRTEEVNGKIRIK
jgi:hypothetical protein